MPRLTAGQWLALLIATGIGVHNFAEGLAIGQSAAADEIGLALALVIGFAAHNATEGFGIVGPMAGEPEPPGWGYLGLLGALGGTPPSPRTGAGGRAVMDERVARGGVPRRRGRLDPLRRHRAARSASTLRGEAARGLDAA